MKGKKFAVVEKKFEYKGHECICIFNYLGFRCGYVSVEENKEFSAYDIDCHCGLTFSGKLPYDYGQTGKYFIGFDCGHICDYQNHEQAYKYGLISENDYYYYLNCGLDFGGVERTLEYVENECKKIVDQLEKNSKS